MPEQSPEPGDGHLLRDGRDPVAGLGPQAPDGEKVPAWRCGSQLLRQQQDGGFCAEASGAALAAGIPLNSQFIGTGYHPDLRLWGDFASQLYLIEQICDKQEEKTL